VPRPARSERILECVGVAAQTAPERSGIGERESRSATIGKETGASIKRADHRRKLLAFFLSCAQLSLVVITSRLLQDLTRDIRVNINNANLALLNEHRKRPRRLISETNLCCRTFCRGRKRKKGKGTKKKERPVLDTLQVSMPNTILHAISSLPFFLLLFSFSFFSFPLPPTPPSKFTTHSSTIHNRGNLSSAIFVITFFSCRRVFFIAPVIFSVRP